MPSIYPAELRLQHSSGGLRTIFMDTMVVRGHAEGNHGPLLTHLYDKRAEPAFSFAVNPFQHASSCTPAASKYNVLHGQLHRFWRILTHPQAFPTAAARLLYLLEKQDYNRAEMVKRCERFLRGKLHGAGPRDAMADILQVLDEARSQDMPPQLQLRDQ